MYKFFNVLIMLFLLTQASQAQIGRGKNFGFGIILGEPTGATLKYWTSRDNALAFSIGGSYFGSPRIGADYLWHFDAFRSRIVELYAGPGAAIGIGEGGGGWYKGEKGRFYYRDDGAGLAIRGVFGVNVIPERTPLEIFFEFGALIGIAPDFGSAIDVALGVRFYP